MVIYCGNCEFALNPCRIRIRIETEFNTFQVQLGLGSDSIRRGSSIRFGFDENSEFPQYFRVEFASNCFDGPKIEQLYFLLNYKNSKS